MDKTRQNLCRRCGKPIDAAGEPHGPFCSERCRTIDLGAWATGNYRIAGERASTSDCAPPKEDDDENK